jgi:hypothetical protein
MLRRGTLSTFSMSVCSHVLPGGWTGALEPEEHVKVLPASLGDDQQNKKWEMDGCVERLISSLLSWLWPRIAFPGLVQVKRWDGVFLLEV